MNKRVTLAISALSALLLLGAPVAGNAILLTWTLNNVSLENTPVQPNTATVAGSFAYDAGTHLIRDWDITMFSFLQQQAFFLNSKEDPAICPSCRNTATRRPGPTPGTDSFDFEHIDPFSPTDSRSFSGE